MLRHVVYEGVIVQPDWSRGQLPDLDGRRANGGRYTKGCGC